MRRPSLLLALLLLPACSGDLDFIRPQRLAVGGEAALGQTIVSEDPSLHITVRIASDATDFDPVNLLRLVVNGIDRTALMTIGGDYATLTIEPPPVGVPQSVELYTRNGETLLDTATYEAMPYTGPTVFNVTPDAAQTGTQVTVAGNGFAAGPVRVFFGGVEGAVDASTDNTVTATVPAGAVPGLILVVVGNRSALGLVPFLPLDSAGLAVPLPSDTWISYVTPATGRIEAVVTVAGINFTDEALPRFNGVKGARVFNLQTLNFALIGDVTTAFAVVSLEATPGVGTCQLAENDNSNLLPFVVE